MATEIATNVKRYCPVCGIPIMRAWADRNEVLACSREHAEQFLREASLRTSVQSFDAYLSFSTVSDDEEEIRRTPGNYC
ncbi:MAG: hypothetical protein HY675_23265 [Chloroflexi bacterium]|nr:hypothetical protein [Chloroflexota bacterium]